VQAFDWSVIVELGARLARRIHNGSHADDEISHDRRAAAPQIRIQLALYRIDIILRRELTRLSTESGMVGEEDLRL